MKLDRIAYAPAAALDFYEEGLTSLDALCERTWHDRLEVVAEGRAAALWQTHGALHEAELHFAPADTSGARDAAREIFPGSPLTFRLAEALRPSPPPLERLVLQDGTQARPPETALTEKLWRGEFPDTTRWRLASPFAADFHFSLVALARCEIQAIDQHWSLRRLAVSLPEGQLDEHFDREFVFVHPEPESAAVWPEADLARWGELLPGALELDLASELSTIRARQENSLRRELDRIDDYFENYARELASRARHTSSENAKLKNDDRLAVARAEHARRRADQLARHEIRIVPHFDALLLVAEPAWRCRLEVERAHCPQTIETVFVPRLRRWMT